MVERSDALDRAFHALSDPSRRAMLDRLAAGPASVSELAQPLQMTLAAVVQHVQVLEASGLIASRKTGRVRTCSINEDALRSAEQWLLDRRTVWQRRLHRLGAVLDDEFPLGQQSPRQEPSPTESESVSDSESASERKDVQHDRREQQLERRARLPAVARAGVHRLGGPEVEDSLV